MDTKSKETKKRLAVLKLAETLGNVSEACRRYGIKRTQFYKFKRRFQAKGVEGLKNLPPIPKSHPLTTPPSQIEQILDLALRHPAYGCSKLESLLAVNGKRLSNVTIQKILKKHRLGTRRERWLFLEGKYAEQKEPMTSEQIAFTEKANPNFRERHTVPHRPGELLCQDTFFVGFLKGVGEVYMHSVVDTFSSYAFGFLHAAKQAEAAVALLHNDVLPFYKRRKLTVSAILTDNNREFHGGKEHPYQQYLKRKGIEHRHSQGKRVLINGFTERFRQTVIDEFYRIELREQGYRTLEALQNDLDKWLLHYNRERPHLGYRNNGEPPYERVRRFISSSAKRGKVVTKEC